MCFIYEKHNTLLIRMTKHYYPNFKDLCEQLTHKHKLVLDLFQQLKHQHVWFTDPFW